MHPPSAPANAKLYIHMCVCVCVCGEDQVRGVVRVGEANLDI